MERNSRLYGGLRLRGRIRAVTRDAATGRRIPHECSDVGNVILTIGLPEFANVLAKKAAAVGYQIAVGTSDTAEDAAQTGLVAEVLRGVVTTRRAEGSALICKLFIDTNQANGETLREAALLHNEVALDRGLITPIEKTAAKTVTVTVTIDLAGGA